MPGFVRVLNSNTLAFPDYDGNGMFKSLGNILVNPHVGMLFIDFEHPDRMRINGTATVHDDDPLLSEYPGAQLIIRIQAEQIFPNCPRYIHKMQVVKYSVYARSSSRARSSQICISLKVLISLLICPISVLLLNRLIAVLGER